MDEIWKEIPNTNGEYLISNYGRVKSKKFKKEHIMAQRKNSKGYFRVEMTLQDGRKKRAFVHRLVAEAFVKNDCPEKNNIVNHLDCIPENNNAENLEWTTLKGNSAYMASLGRNVRTDEWREKLSSTLVRKYGKAIIGTNIETGEDIFLENLNKCEKFGFQPSCVSNCCNGKRYQTGGYKWRFAARENAPRN